MLRRLPRHLLLSHARYLQPLNNLAGQDTVHVTRSVCTAGQHTAVPLASGLGASGDSRWRIWETWPALLGFAAAAAWHSRDRAAHADASTPDQAWYTAAQAAAGQAVTDAFNEAVLDWQRSIAQHSSLTPKSQGKVLSAQNEPPATSSSSNSHAQGPERPSVSYDGFQVSVDIPLLAGVDLPALLAAVQAGVDQLARNSRRVEQQQQSWLLSTQWVQHWQLRRLTGGKDPGLNPARGSSEAKSSPATMQQLSVQVVVPLQGNSPHEASSSDSSSSIASSAGYVQLAKAAPFTADELEMMAKLVAAANKPGSGQGLGQPESFFSPWGIANGPDRVLGGFDKLGGALVGSMLAELLHELQHGLDFDQEQQQQEDAGDWNNRMDRFFGNLSQRLGDGLSSKLQDESFEQQIHSLQQLLQRELRSMTPPDVIEWLHNLTDQEADVAGGEEGPELQQDSSTHKLPPLSPSGSSSSSSAGDAHRSAGAAAAVQQDQQQQQPLLPWQQPSAQSAMRQLEQLGAAVYLPTAAALQADTGDGTAAAAEPQWGVLAGYEAQKQALEDCLLLPLKHPEVYDSVSSRTRASAKPGGARPRAVLFEGPPGTGKTSTARVLAGRASLPLVYVPLEMLVSKWYGESEQNMAKIFKSCEALGGCIIFLDELDSLATSRDQGDMHEASRRLLGVMLREIDGFNHRDSGSSSSDGSGGDSSKRSVVIGATNRRQDLDAALLSRFDLSIHFGLPDEPCRAAILQQYAHQLTEADRDQLAAVTSGFSGRDLRDVCEQTERAWASKIIRGQVESEELPGVEDYLAAVQQRRQGAGRSAAATPGGPGGHTGASY